MDRPGMGKPDRHKLVMFYITVGLATVQVGRIALFSHSTANRALSIAQLILIAFVTGLIARQGNRKK